MKSKMSSKDRLISTINLEEPDHVPFSQNPHWNHTALLPPPHYCMEMDQFERVLKELKLGFDPVMRLEARPSYGIQNAFGDGWKINPDVEIKMWKEVAPGETYPLLHKEYHTEKGVLTQIVRQTADWPHGDELPLWSDHIVPPARSKKYLIENMEDLESFSSLFSEPTDEEREAFFEDAARIKRFADEHEVLVESPGNTMQLGDVLAISCGVKNMITMSLRQPELISQLLDILVEWNLKYLKLILEADAVDIISLRAWYEIASFWSPKTYQRFLVPRLRKLVQEVHKGGVKFCYIMTRDIMPLIGYFKDIGIDILFGVDPVQGGMDLQRVKEEMGDEICLWGGVNSHVTLGFGTREAVEKETREAIHILGRGGGFILSAIDEIDKNIPWKNVEYMIGIWRKNCKYHQNTSSCVQG